MGLIITESKGFAVLNFYYKPIGLKWSKQKTIAVAGLQAFLHLEHSPPQAALERSTGF